jgi:DNA-binding winged helix-turn-helix (wHTH) protein
MNSNPGPAGEPAVVVQFDEFTFDSRSRLLTRNGIERRLSPKALLLLGLLLQERPRALSREEIYDALWPSTFVCETNMAGIVNELRRALGDQARGSSYIRTVHGFGYAFCGKVGGTAQEREPLSVAAVLHCEDRENPLYEGENVVGRSLDGRVTLTDHTVSRRHAVIIVFDGMVSIKDLESKNGTFIDGQLLGPMPVTVNRHALIEFGAAAASITVPRVSSTPDRSQQTCLDATARRGARSAVSRETARSAKSLL